MRTMIAALLLACTTLVATAALAQDRVDQATDMQALRTALQKDKRAYVASTLQLTPTEAKRFWPAYETYQRSLDRADRQRVVAVEALISADRPASELYARNLTRELIAPYLRMEKLSDAIVLSWPTNAVDFKLERKSALGTFNWSAYDGNVFGEGSQWKLRLTNTVGQEYFRLKK